MSKNIRRVVIFDFDGTIANSFGEVVRILNGMAADYGFERIKKSDTLRFREMSAREIMAEIKIPKWKLLAIARKSKVVFNSCLPKIPLVRGMAGILKELDRRDFILGVLSSNSKENIEKFLELKKITSFDFIYSENNFFGKDKKLKKIMKKYGFIPGEVYYAGDEARDIEAAKKAGVSSVAVTWGFNTKKILKKHSPDNLIEKPKDLLKIF